MPPESFNNETIRQLRPALERPTAGDKPLGVSDEWEASSPRGEPVVVRTIFLRGSECRFHCVMCDLWRYTHEGATPSQVIPRQIRSGLAEQCCIATNAPARPQWLKLYNASSFFDTHNVPAADLTKIALLLDDYDRVIVENHPRILPWPAIEQFQRRIAGRLEVALGLETIDPNVLPRLNKRITTDDFARAAEGLQKRNIDVRVFVLLRPPWTDEQAGIEWCRRSVDFAIQHGARHVTIIPVRGGNGVLESLAAQGQFEPPLAASLEKVSHDFLFHDRCVVTADLWDWHKLRGTCAVCSEPRRLRLERMNVTRSEEAAITCEVCNVGTG